MKKFFFFFTSTFFLTATALAQVNDGGGHSMMQINIKPDDNMLGVEGSTYFYEDYRPGTISMEGKEPLQVFLRYNINTETFEIKTEKAGEETYVLPLKTGTRYYLGPEIFAYRAIKFEGRDIAGYFQSHYDGDKVSLIEKPSLIITEGVKAQTGYGNDKPRQIKLTKDLYLVFKDGSVKKVSLKEKDFEKAFAASPKVKTYLAENKLKTLDDYIKMLEWYNNQAE